MSELDICVALALIPIIIIISIWSKSPFQYPYFVYYIDISKRRNPVIGDVLDDFLNSGNFQLIEAHHTKVELWKQECHRKIQRSLFKHHREKQFLSCLDDCSEFKFYFVRLHTRYIQRNYVRHSYKVSEYQGQFFCDYKCLQEREQQLRSINHECTLSRYYSQNQRSLMTKDLRRKIMIRDNYTCQICGKYMPDEVGLQIDHIIPISRGGKTIPSNLQVLCSRCNGRKSNNF